MSILKATSKAKRKQIMLYIDENLLDEINEYCKWAGINKIHDFIEQATKFVFSKDAEWKKNTK